jgi:hypothetical protein
MPAEILEDNDEFKITHRTQPHDDGYGSTHEGWFNLTHKPTGSTSGVYFTTNGKDVGIEGMNSGTKRQGHMTRIMHHLYNRYPGFIDFGGTSHEGTFIASKMESIYGRTDFDPNGEDH